jgi:hypothetical protein
MRYADLSSFLLDVLFGTEDDYVPPESGALSERNGLKTQTSCSVYASQNR